MTESPSSAPQQPHAVGGDLIIPTLAVAFTLYYFWSIWGLTFVAQINGLMIGSVLLVLCAALFVRIFREVRAGTATLGLGALVYPLDLFKRRLGLATLSVLFVVLLPWTGVTLGLILFLSVGLYVTGIRSRRMLILIPLTVSGLAYLLFIVFLHSRLPFGPIEQFINWVR